MVVDRNRYSGAVMTPIQWNAELAESVGWKEAYPHVEREAKRVLDGLPEGGELTTTDLVEELYPSRFAQGEGILARKRIFKALRALIRHGLAGYVTQLEEQVARKGPMKGRYVRPRVWHRKKPITGRWGIFLTDAGGPYISCESAPATLELLEYLVDLANRAEAGTT